MVRRPGPEPGGGESGSLTGVVTTEGDTLPCQLLIGATGFAGCEQGVWRPSV